MGLESLDDLRIFTQVMESGGLTSAGKVLHLARNQISRRLARLERTLGARLFERTTRSITPTEAGRALYAHAVALLETAAKAEQAVAPGAALQGRVRLAVKTSSIEFALVQELAAALEQHPGLSLQLIVRDEPVDLVAEGVDLSLQVGMLPDSTNIARAVGSAHFVLAASPQYLERHGRPLQPRELADHQCLRRLGPLPELAWNLIGPGGREVTARIGGRFECSDARAQAEAMRAGLGIAPRPAGEVRQAVQRGELVRVLPAWRLAPIPVWAVSPPGKARLARVSLFVELLRRVIRKLE